MLGRSCEIESKQIALFKQFQSAEMEQLGLLEMEHTPLIKKERYEFERIR